MENSKIIYYVSDKIAKNVIFLIPKTAKRIIFLYNWQFFITFASVNIVRTQINENI